MSTKSARPDDLSPPSDLLQSLSIANFQLQCHQYEAAELRELANLGHLLVKLSELAKRYTWVNLQYHTESNEWILKFGERVRSVYQSNSLSETIITALRNEFNEQ